jgi:hypothetical protein
MSQKEPSFFERERDRLSAEITAVRTPLSSSKEKNTRRLPGIRGITLLEQRPQPQAGRSARNDEGIRDDRVSLAKLSRTHARSTSAARRS